ADTFTAENKPMLFSVANYLQSIPFEVHAPTLTAIKRVWGSGGGALGVPCRNVPDRPPFPFGEGWNKDEAPEEELDTFLRWKRRASQHYTELRAWRSKVREVGGLLKVLRSEKSTVWFP